MKLSHFFQCPYFHASDWNRLCECGDMCRSSIVQNFESNFEAVTIILVFLFKYAESVFVFMLECLSVYFNFRFSLCVAPIILLLRN